MGKSQKGKELGTGISQRKDGLYTGRVTDPRTGKRIQKYFRKLQECRKWVADTQYEIAHGNALYSDNPTVEAWYKYWFDNIKVPILRESSQRKYESSWKLHILPVIGDFTMQDIKPIHCSEVLRILKDKDYADRTIKAIKNTMHDFFESAVQNKIIKENPVVNTVQAKGIPPKKIHALTIQEQKDFLTYMQNSVYYTAFALALQTGMRCGELIALTWDDIDFENNVLYVNKTMTIARDASRKVGLPKSKAGIRKIPLTTEAKRVLNLQKEKNSTLKVVNIQYANNVFLTRNGTIPNRNGYCYAISTYCTKNNVERFTMHSLRHTFATRCMEAGMKPKVLQKILGHSNISITMNLYVHALDEVNETEMLRVQDYIKVV